MNSPTDEVIKRRYSCRKYSERPLAEADRVALSQSLASVGAGPFGNHARLSVVAATEADRTSLKGLGTYGAIKGATGFIVGAVRPAPGDMEDYGYSMEHVVLAATDLGLGTCWLGGSFTKSSFARKIAAASDEVVPAVVAVGYPADGSRDDWIRRRAGSDRRLSSEQLFFQNEPGRPLQAPASDRYAPVLEAVRWAPSASNKQPWRLVEASGAWHFYLDRTKGYGKGTVTFALMRLADLQRVDMGIAMCHFELSARSRGLGGGWASEPPAFADVPDGWVYVLSWMPGVG